MEKRIQLWVGKEWSEKFLGLLHERLDPFCDFVALPQEAEIVLVNDGMEILNMNGQIPPHVLCLALERPWVAQSHHVTGVRFELVHITLRLMYLFGLSRAGIVETPTAEV